MYNHQQSFTVSLVARALPSLWPLLEQGLSLLSWASAALEDKQSLIQFSATAPSFELVGVVLLLISIYGHLLAGPRGTYQSCIKLYSRQLRERLLSGTTMPPKIAAYSFEEGIRSQRQIYITCQDSAEMTQKVIDTSPNSTHNSILP
jgi:hypothetical protein